MFVKQTSTRAPAAAAGVPRGKADIAPRTDRIVAIRCDVFGTTEARTRMPSRAADFRTTPAFAGAAPSGARGLDCALAVCPTTRRPRPSSLYTFTFRRAAGGTGGEAKRAWLGVVMRPLECSNVREEFTDFERIPIVVSGRSAQRCKSAVSANSTTSRGESKLAGRPREDRTLMPEDTGS